MGCETVVAVHDDICAILQSLFLTLLRSNNCRRGVVEFFFRCYVLAINSAFVLHIHFCMELWTNQTTITHPIMTTAALNIRCGDEYDEI